MLVVEAVVLMEAFMKLVVEVVVSMEAFMKLGTTGAPRVSRPTANICQQRRPVP